MKPGPVCVLLLLLAAVRTDAEECSAQAQAAINLSIRSRRNETRHRIVQVALAAESNVNNELALDVSQSFFACDALERVGLTSTVSALEPEPRRSDYELFPGLGYYKLHTTGTDWDQARLTCLRENAHLIVIDSKPESDVVRVFFARKPTFRNTTSSNIVSAGFHDRDSEGHYITVTGHPLKYTPWASGEPSKSPLEDQGGLDKSGLLHDIDDSFIVGFICEKEI